MVSAFTQGVCHRLRCTSRLRAAVTEPQDTKKKINIDILGVNTQPQPSSTSESCTRTPISPCGLSDTQLQVGAYKDSQEENESLCGVQQSSVERHAEDVDEIKQHERRELSPMLFVLTFLSAVLVTAWWTALWHQDTPTFGTRRVPEPRSMFAPATSFGHQKFEEALPCELVTLVGTRHHLQPSAAKAWYAMKAAARSDGVYLACLSAFRSKLEQADLFNEWQRIGTTPAQRASYVAPPGYSEHHTGLALDIGDEESMSTAVSERFERTAAFRWMRQHGSLFGFHMSFPMDAQSRVAYEPWHWRFQGDSESRVVFGWHDYVWDA